MLTTEIILGYPIATAGIDSCLQQIRAWLKNGDYGRVVACANPHSLVIAKDDQEFRQALLSFNILAPDGAGILMASRILDGGIRERVTGSDIFFGLSNLLNCEAPDRFGYFFLGSTEETLIRIRERMSKDFPNVTVAGCCSPPFRDEFREEDNCRMIEAVNKAAPDVLWVGMTAPKQEKWIYRNKDKLGVKCIGAIGAVFDFYSGNVKRSHPWFLEHGLEWMPRLIQEPRRLWRRMFISAPVFLWLVFMQRLRGAKNSPIERQYL